MSPMKKLSRRPVGTAITQALAALNARLSARL
jgi:hypothetical protein